MLFPVAAEVQKENEENSENNGYFNSGVESLRLEIFQEHTNYNELRSKIKEDLPGKFVKKFVKNGYQYDHSNTGFYLKRNEEKDQIEVCLKNFNFKLKLLLRKYFEYICSLYCFRYR